jgi:L,D-peptidoglycan transpeptidase YkuD (ErfK/YbiS/YcfS/YnhG family)
MIIIKESGFLLFNKIKYRCALGISGIKKNKIEGDGATPAGTYKLIKLYYRKDRISFIKSAIKKIIIKKKTGWCDDIRSKFYNKEVKLPSKYSHEKFYRRDNVYDIIGILNYNIKPTIKGKGSAISLHLAKKKFAKTKGCVALKKKDLIYILSKINKNTKIKILIN